MKIPIACIALIFAINTNLMAQDAGIKQNIKQAARNPQTEERAAKADVLLTSKRRLISSDAIKKNTPNKNMQANCSSIKSNAAKRD